MAVSPLLVSSVLPADYADLGRQVQEIEKAGVDRIQWDVMDGRFVPNITFGPDVIASCRGRVDGGIGSATIGAAARVFCAGSALFTGPGTMTDRAQAMRTAAAGVIV